MKRIYLNMNEQLKYDVIKSLVDHDGNKKAAALKLGCTTRTVNRLQNTQNLMPVTAMYTSAVRL